MQAEFRYFPESIDVARPSAGRKQSIFVRKRWRCAPGGIHSLFSSGVSLNGDYKLANCLIFKLCKEFAFGGGVNMEIGIVDIIFWRTLKNARSI